MVLDRTVVSFFVLFSIVYFLEAIGGFYMTSAVVAIEKQFQIPSKISGMMVSAGDFGYIPSVVIVSYLGGKGNRAKWIGGGCMLIAIANLLISTSNFLFPVERVDLKTSDFQETIERDISRMANEGASIPYLLPHEIRRIVAGKGGLPATLQQCEKLIDRNQSSTLCNTIQSILHVHNPSTITEVENLRAITATTYAFCSKSLNRLRAMMDKVRCTRDASYFGPTATIFFGLFLLGIGRTMPYSLGLPLVDDNVKKANLPLYFAGMFFIRILGPVIGLMMGSVFNKYYYTFDPPQGLTPRDPMWIGRWWCGFLVMGFLLFGPSLALFCFKTHPSYHEEDENREDGAKDDLLKGKSGSKKKPRRLALVDRHAERTADGKTVVPDTFQEKMDDFVITMKSVITQPVYVGLLVGRIIDVMAFKGFFVFLPKYLEIHFGVPQYKINFYMGLIGIVGFAIGVSLGSLLMRFLRLEGRKAAAWVAICSLLAALLSFLNAGVGCQSTMSQLGEIASRGAPNTTAVCSRNCYCENVPIYPVCDPQGNVYYSPCHAGCPSPNPAEFALLDPKLPPTFANCSCVKQDAERRVSRDYCVTDDCNWKIKVYFLNMALGGVVGGLGVTPGMLIMLRSVPPRHRSVSLGFSGFLVSILATLPSPIIWGAIIDYFCVQWEKKCDGRGACVLYSTEKLRIWMHGIYGGLRLLALLADFYVLYHAKGLKIMGEEKEEEEDNKDSTNEHIEENNDKLNDDPLPKQFKPKDEQDISRTSTNESKNAA
ncbi:unnamed protein product [Bursaphelenchus xylophilus]|uniref:Solute carrier organic anion transporter family member n=1 Tax=Bursaphelenchus xylophilus TaxID=6326 RepID=A0A1I7RN99_BURXY|nr:unnamed protein product [Bursaphelenchus xylophilus]CAG9123794.1 unnamed protein product [Bursaphelenchus xylophilus]